MMLRNLLRRPMRTALTLVGITIATAAILALSALAEGLLTNFAAVVATFGADLIVAAKQEPGTAIQVVINSIDERFGDELRAMPEVRQAAGVLYTVMPMPGIPYFVVFGHEPEGFAIGRFRIVEGQGLQARLPQARGRPLILGKTAARSFHKGVGDTLLIGGVTFRILGLFETGSVIEDGAAVTTLAEAQRLANQPEQVSGFLVRLVRPDQVEQVREQLQRRLPELQILQSSEGGSLAGWLKMIRPFAWSVAIIAALMGGLGMMNAMLMSVIERTREIGVLRALGWTARQVLALILSESFVLTLLGGLAGVLVGTAAVALLGSVPRFAGLIRGTLSVRLLIQVLASALIIGSVGGAYPAWRATRFAPAEALRYDGGTASVHAGPTTASMPVRDLFRQRARSALTLLGVGVGVLAVTAMSSLTEGLFAEFETMFSTAELTATETNAADLSLSIIDERVGAQMQRIPGVRSASGGMITLANLSEVPLFVIGGYEPGGPQLQRFRFRSGGPPPAARQIALGWKAAQALKKDVGDTITLLGSRFRIVGLYEHGSEHFDYGALITLRELQKLMHRQHKVQFYEIKLVDASHLDSVLAALQQEFPDLTIARSSEFMEYQADMRTMMRFSNAILALTLLTGTVIVMNTMGMSVFERTREIGVLRALGWRPRDVLGLFVTEALLLTSAAGVLGVAASWLLLNGLSLLPALGTIRALAAWTPHTAMRVTILCVGMGICGGLYPAWRATQLRPVEALRYE